MSAMPRVDLNELTQNRVKMLTGHHRGLSGREHFHLDQLDTAPEAIVIVAPESLDAITPSFVQGFLAASLVKLGSDQFEKHYDFSRLPRLLQEDMRTGIERLKLHMRSRPPSS